MGNLPIHVALKLGSSEMVIALLDVNSEEFTDSEENNYYTSSSYLWRSEDPYPSSYQALCSGNDE